jgi:hypothetical protein
VAYQIRDVALVTVGSEELEPTDGWPYDKILAALAAKPQMTPKDLGVAIVKNYLAAYRANAGVTQACCDLTRAEALVQTIDQLAQAMTAGIANPKVFPAILQSRAQVQSYDTPDYVDLYNFCELLAERAAAGGIRTACEKVMDSIREPGFVLASGYKGSEMEHSNGVAIYFPEKKISPLYKNLDFTKRTKWEGFLKAYIKAVRQPPPHPGRRSSPGRR